MSTLPVGNPAPLPPAQQRTLDALVGFVEEHGYAPTLRDLANRTGLSSTNALREHLRALRKKGHVIWDDGITRSLRVIQEAA